MAIGTNALHFLVYARQQGVNFSTTATLGRQRLSVDPELCRQVLGQGFAGGTGSVGRKLYSEPLFRALGAGMVEAFDYSDYEEAAHVHDFNFPIPERYHQQYSVVLDGGTLEHIFHFPVAVKNCMEMVALGGHFVAMTPANNYMGHGFYQFSPELFYRMLSSENGFRVERMLLRESGERSPWLSVSDPEDVGRRVTLRSPRRAQLFLMARRVAITPVFASPPLQSDYVPRWQTDGTATDPGQKKPGPSQGVARGLRRLLRRLGQPYDPDLYTVVELPLS